jgi:hypothetical protein
MDMGLIIKSLSLVLVFWLAFTPVSFAASQCFSREHLFYIAASPPNPEGYLTPLYFQSVLQDLLAEMQENMNGIGEGKLSISLRDYDFAWDFSTPSSPVVTYSYCVDLLPSDTSKNLSRLFFSSAQFAVFHGFSLLLTCLFTMK